MKFVGKVSSLGVGRVRKEEPRVPQGYGAYGTCVPMSQASVQSMRRLSCEDAASLGSVSGYPEGRPNPVRNTRTAAFCVRKPTLSMPDFGAIRAEITKASFLERVNSRYALPDD